MDVLHAKTDSLVVDGIKVPVAGMATEPDGKTFWVCSATEGKTVSVYHVDISNNKVLKTVPLIKTDGTGTGRYIALQTDDRNKVINVWVTTYGVGKEQLFYFDTTKLQAAAATVPAGVTELRDILWDKTSGLLWVSDDTAGIFTIDPKTAKTGKPTVSVKDVRRLALTTPGGKSRVWFTHSDGEKFKVGFCDATAQRSDLSDAVNSAPYSLVADDKGQNLWMVLDSGELWQISQADAAEASKMTLKSTAAFGQQARQILRDIHGYLWVSLVAEGVNGTAGLAECLPDGQVKGMYALKNAAGVYDIAYTAVTDTFYLTDNFADTGKESITQFQSADWHDPKAPELTLTGADDIEAQSGKTFPSWTVTVKDKVSSKAPTTDVNVDLLVSDSLKGVFEVVPGKPETGVAVRQFTAKANVGIVGVDSLYAKGENGSSFDVYAMIRGQTKTPQKVVTAGIYAPVTKVEVKSGQTITVHTTKESFTPLSVQISAETGSKHKRAVKFTSPDKNVLLSDGVTSKTSQTIYTDTDGAAQVIVHGGASVAANISVDIVCGGTKPGKPPVVNVLSLPTAMTLPVATGWHGVQGGEASAEFVIHLTDAQNKPCAGEHIDLNFDKYGKEVSSAYVQDNNKPGELVAQGELKKLLITDKDGKVTLGRSPHPYGIVCGHSMKTIHPTVSYLYEDGDIVQDQTYTVSPS